MRTLSSDGGVAARSIIGSNLLADAMSLRSLSQVAANALGRAMMGAVLIAVSGGGSESDEEGENVQLQLRGDGPLGSVMAISDARGRVRGTVAHYSGSVPLVSGEIARDITLYLSESEQIPSAMGLGVATADDESAAVAAGFLVQVMPGADPEHIARVEANVKAMPRLSDLVLTGTDCNDLLDRLLDGLGSRDRHTSQPVFYCPCTRERALRTLALLGVSELQEMILAETTQEVRCEFCARSYHFDAGAMLGALPTA
jgi:molecular chaperone Hsp33